MTTEQFTNELTALVCSLAESLPASDADSRRDALTALLAVASAFNEGKFRFAAPSQSGKYVVERSDVIGKTVTINGAPISRYGLSRQGELIIWSLYRRHPTISQFAEEVFGDPLTPQSTIRTAVARCNHNLEKLGWTLELIGKGQGWRLLVE